MPTNTKLIKNSNHKTMNKRHSCLLILCLVASCMLLDSCRQNQEQSLYASFKPYTRWWWFSSEIDDNDLRDQLIWLRDHEFGGVEIAWIYPMGLDSATGTPRFCRPNGHRMSITPSMWPTR